MKIFTFLMFLILNMSLWAKNITVKENPEIVQSTIQIKLDEFSSIWNPSIVKIEKGFLLTFRYCLAPDYPWISYIGAVLLNKDLVPISEPQLLATRNLGDKTSSQAEDARVFELNGELYLLYNDCRGIENPCCQDRRDMYLAKIQLEGTKIQLQNPTKLVHSEKYDEVIIQKNWVPFSWNGHVLFGYSLNPHEVLISNIKTGICEPLCESSFNCDWNWGNLRGGTPAVLVDGEYLAFFHSSEVTSSNSSNGIRMYHYYMGAYTFSADPPFAVKCTSKEPIVGKNFYTNSKRDKRVIFPGGFAVVGSKIYLAYGKDDNELWIATINKSTLKKAMKPVCGP